MLSTAKLTANANNAHKSCGPRSSDGLRRSSQNALRHGFTATSIVVIEGVEDPSEYAVLLDAVLNDFDASGPVETLLAERVAQLFWRLRRVVRFETERLSQSQRELMPTISGLDVMLRERALRDRRLSALGMLFLPGDHSIARDAVDLIMESCAEALDRAESAIFIQAVTRRHRSATAEHTVAAVSEMIRIGESSLLSAGLPNRNVAALAYEYWAGVSRAWGTTSRAIDSGQDRLRTEALLLEIEKANIIERYEPRLRRDLSRTLRDLADVQARRRAGRLSE